MNQNQEQAFVCDLTAIPEEFREQHLAAIPKIFQAAQDVQELPNGYAFKFPNEPGLFMILAHFVEHERQCCPFYNFLLEVEAHGGPFWLHLTGGEGVKEFIQIVFQDLPTAVADGLIQTGSDTDLAEIVDKAAPVLANTIAIKHSGADGRLAGSLYRKDGEALPDHQIQE